MTPRGVGRFVANLYFKRDLLAGSPFEAKIVA